MQRLIEFLKGKKTYLLVAAAFIYGGLIQIGVCKHYPQLDILFAGCTLASLRAGISKLPGAPVIAAVALGAVLLLSGCQSVTTGAAMAGLHTEVGATVAAQVTNAAVNSGIAKLADSVDGYSANAYAHSVATGLRTLEGTPLVSTADIQAAVTAWGDPAQPNKWHALGKQVAEIVTRYGGHALDAALEAAAVALQTPPAGN
ncbi:MAG TPA: hypothetical protein VK474_09005 [Chthoniobacterales bacterium]|nr:hypothetical protein [Chthoniobacterales bacterium]